MKNIMTVATILFLAVAANNSWAADKIVDISVEEALIATYAKLKFGDEVRFYFGNQKHREVLEKIVIVGTNKKTMASSLTEYEGCIWAFMGAIKTLRGRAIKEGGNAVINIKSNYKKVETVSDSTFKCAVGAMLKGVALKGTIVKLEGTGTNRPIGTVEYVNADKIDMVKLFRGKSVEGKVAEGAAPYKMYFSSRSDLVMQDSLGNVERGSWSVTGGKLCIDFSEDDCGDVKKFSNGVYYIMSNNGVLRFTIEKIIAGDPFGLKL